MRLKHLCKTNKKYPKYFLFEDWQVGSSFEESLRAHPLGDLVLLEYNFSFSSFKPGCLKKFIQVLERSRPSAGVLSNAHCVLKRLLLCDGTSHWGTVLI